jgi:hypothetical protein
MNKSPICNGRKVKDLALKVNQCFYKIIGEPPNENFKYHSPEEIAFIMAALNTMVDNYLVDKPSSMFNPVFIVEQNKVKHNAPKGRR